MLSIQYAQAARRLGLVAAGVTDDGLEPDLTAKQIECLQWVAAGKSTWEISEILMRSEYTINEHLAAARKRLGVRTTTQAVVQAVLRGLVRP
jgi:LuxR family quorum-sensing transcriptional regulator LasR